jgi:hypothetical protein
VFDNRLDAGELRKESYRFPIPHDAKGTLTVVARLYYLPYPSSFTSKLGLPKSLPVEVAAATKEIALAR